MHLRSLLNSKNRCLERFLALSAAFLQEMDRPPIEGEVDDLSGVIRFQSQRDATLKAIDLYDRKISDSVKELSDLDRTPELTRAVEASLARREKLIHEILAIDLKIISRIEIRRNEILKEMSESRKGLDTLKKFKSSWVPESGEELDTKL